MAKIKENDNLRLKNEKMWQNGMMAKAIAWIKENFSTIILPLIAIILLALGIYFYSVSSEKITSNNFPTRSSQEAPANIETQNETNAKVSETKTTTENQIGTGGPEVAKVEIYTEKAGKGEGITHLARKALKKYLSSEGSSLNLSKEHKIYIEDYMKDKTGNFKLKVGQEISFSVNLIKEAILRAQKLTQSQLNNLKQYSKLVPSL